MLPDRVPNPGPLTYESCALPTALRGPAQINFKQDSILILTHKKRRKGKCIFQMFPGVRHCIKKSCKEFLTEIEAFTCIL